MADKWPLANGNWSSAANWNGGTKPVAGDYVYADGKTVTIDENVTVANLFTTTRSGGTAGGGFSVSSSVTINANVTAGSSICVTFSGTTGTTLTINGQISGSQTSGNCSGVSVTSTGALVVTSAGNFPLGGGNTNGSHGIDNLSSGTVTVTGNPLGGTSGNSRCYGIRNASTGTVYVTGNPRGNVSGVSNAEGIANESTGSVYITGNPTGSASGSSPGVRNSGTGYVQVTGDPTGGTGGAGPGVLNQSTGTVYVIGNPTGGSNGHGLQNSVAGAVWVHGECRAGSGLACVGVYNVSTGFLGLSGSGNLFTANVSGAGQGTIGLWTSVAAVQSGGSRTVQFANAADSASITNRIYKAGNTTLYGPSVATATAVSASDVRSGVVVGTASGTVTGTCAVPGASSVAAGVPVDNTTGTAILTGSTLRSALGMASANMDAQFAAIAVDLTPVLNRLPTALEGGRIAAALSSTVLTQLFADADVTDLVNQIAEKFDGVDDLPIATIAGAVRDAILNRVLAGNHDTAGTPGKILQDTLTQASASASSAATAATQSSSANSNSAAAKSAAESVDGKLSAGRLSLIDGAAQKGTGTNTLATIADLINNLETGGLTPEQETQLDNVQNTVTAISAALAGAPVEPTGRIASGGGIVAYIGDDFRVRSGTQLQIPVSDPSGGLYTKLNAIGATNLAFGASRPDKAAGAISGTVASLATSGSGASQLLLITVEIENCGSGLRPGDDYTYQIEDRQTQGTEVDSFVRIEGSMELRKKVV